MKKSYFVIGGLIAAFAAIILSVFLLKGRNAKPEPGTVATVNGVAITEQQVNELIQVAQISNAIYEVWIPQLENPEIKEMQYIFPTDFTAITKRLVRSEVIRQYLAKQNALISYDDVCKGTDQTLSLLLSEDEVYKTAFENAMKTFHTTKGQYIDLYYDGAYMVYSAEKAKSLFEKSGQYDKASDQSLEDQFKKFVDSLEEQASIVYNSDKINAAVS